MSASFTPKNRKAWRDRPDVVLISVRRSERLVFNAYYGRWIPRVTLTYQVLGTRAECEAANGGAPVDPGVYGPETILTAWDLGLSQKRLRALQTWSPEWEPCCAYHRRLCRSSRKYQARLARAVATHFGFHPRSPFTGAYGRGTIKVDSGFLLPIRQGSEVRKKLTRAMHYV